MFRARLATRALSRATVPRAAVRYESSALIQAHEFKEVKFVKEDVDDVMTELPEFNFYEMKESAPNPYNGSTLDKSILIDPPSPALAAPTVGFSKLENGLKVATVDRQGLTARLGLFVDTGSRFETSADFGVSHMVSLMAYRSTAHLSHLRTVKTLEQLGANAVSTCTAGREEIVYQVDVMREFVPLVVPLMIGNVLFPRLLPWEVKAAQKLVKTARASLEGDADGMVSELLHKAAYCNNTLGYSTLASDRSMPYFTPETIRSFMLDHFAPERMVLVGVNVAQDELSKWAMRSFADYNAIPMKERTTKKALYTGGASYVEGSSPFCHLAIALESMPWGPGLAAMTVMQALLGGGSAVADSIGTGVTSRLSTQVVQQSPYVESCAAFNTSYSDSGLFGVYGVCQPDKAADMAKGMAAALAGLTSVSDAELSTAKAMLKGRLLRQADEESMLMKDLGQQLLMTGAYGSASDFCNIIDGVTAGDVAAAAGQMLASKPTVAAFGDTHGVPHYAAIEDALKV